MFEGILNLAKDEKAANEEIMKHPKKYKLKIFFFSIKLRDKSFINIHRLFIYWHLHEPIQSKKEKEKHNQS
jgi:hypothetical protein